MATPKAAPRRRSMRRKAQIEYYGDDFKAIVDKYKSRALFAAGQVVLDAAERSAPRKSGRLQGSGYVGTVERSTYRARRWWRREKKVGPGIAVVAFTAPHAHLVESGRKKARKFGPRKAYGKRAGKKALKFNGRWMAWSRVKRLSGRHFLATALAGSKDALLRELVGRFSDALEREMPE